MDKLEEDLEHILQHTHDLWKSLSGKTIFVTGGTGFFGIWLQMSFVYINRKQNLQANMVILTRNKKIFFDKYPSLSNNAEISFVEGDICSFPFFHILHYYTCFLLHYHIPISFYYYLYYTSSYTNTYEFLIITYTYYEAIYTFYLHKSIIYIIILLS